MTIKFKGKAYRATYDTEKEAAQAYDEKAREFYGAKAKTNYTA